jgi:hypothetical protein
MTIKALLPSPRYTGHDVTESVMRNIGNVLTNCIFKAVNVREGVSKNLSFQIPPTKKCNSSGHCECYPGHSPSRHGQCTWEMAAMP